MADPDHEMLPKYDFTHSVRGKCFDRNFEQTIKG